MSFLVVLKGPAAGQQLPLDGDSILLGRDPNCHIVIPGNAPSRRHALISRLGGQYFIEDGDGAGSHSRGGTFVNNERLPFDARVLLRDNDYIRICDFRCTFHDSQTPPSDEAAPEAKGKVGMEL